MLWKFPLLRWSPGRGWHISRVDGNPSAVWGTQKEWIIKWWRYG